MPLHDVVEINCKKGATTETKAQMSSIWAKECVLMISPQGAVNGL